MSFGMGLGAGLKALTAARLGIQTAGQNVANANTVGYSRQRLLLASSVPYQYVGGMQIGTGVDVRTVQRLVDEGLEGRLRMQNGLAAGAQVDHSRWQEIEELFAEPDGGIGQMLGEFFGRVGKLQTDAGDRALRGGVVQAGKVLADGFNLLADRMGTLRRSTFDEVRGLVRQLNEKGAEVAELNLQIVAVEASGQTANDLRDMRDQVVKEMSSLADVRVLERDTGSMDLVVAGTLVVAGGRATPLQVQRDGGTTTMVTTVDTRAVLNFQGGRIGALLRHETADNPELMSKVDGMARSLALELNRVHTTGVPRTGFFTSLVSSFAAEDTNNNGVRGDELLSQSGVPFEIQDGALYVTVTNKTTRELERTRIDVDPESMSLRDFAAALDRIDHLDASLDPVGRLRIQAEQGYGFDFASRLDSSPDSFGSFGGGAPSFATAGQGPFAMTVPASFSVTVGTSTRTVNLAATDFVNPAAATVDELVAAINDDLGGDAVARNVAGRLVVRANAAGTATTMTLADGAGGPLAALGMATGPRSGQSPGVQVEVSGKYTGSTNQRFTFQANQDGVIGVTPGLTVGVYDENGNLVTTLEVGRGKYSPGGGDLLEVADGIKVSFGPGTISATHGDVFAVDALADSDSSDVLVALGLNTFFLGNSAADLRVNPDLLANPDLLSAGTIDATGDGSNMARWMELRGAELAELGGTSFEDYYGDLVGELGFQVASAEATMVAQDELHATLEAQRQQISGVNLDEEMVDLVRHQQAFEAASRFISMVSELSRTLVQIGA